MYDKLLPKLKSIYIASYTVLNKLHKLYLTSCLFVIIYQAATPSIQSKLLLQQLLLPG